MLRKAKNQDLSQVYQLINLASKSGKVLPRDKSDLKKVIKSFFVYEEDENIIGCCSLEIYNQKLAELRSLVVLPEFQKKGIGSLLIKECIKKAKAEKVYEVLAVTDKDKFFQKSGFSKQLENQYPMFFRFPKNRK